MFGILDAWSLRFIKTKILIYTDGAARGNPGLAGAGAVIKNEAGQTIAFLKKFLGENKTNNEAEYLGVLLALDWLSQNRKKGKEVQFFFDSQLLTNQLSGNWKIKAQNLKPLVAKIREGILALDKKVTFHHLSREKNSLADLLANQAIDERKSKKNSF
ncbi:ribonuclease HI family protein [Candidatus Shapirobacteria bacterium]|nr:ribonuclease HI family protein [Candidatus Shapirobacteria bacterium]